MHIHKWKEHKHAIYIYMECIHCGKRKTDKFILATLLKEGWPHPYNII